MPDDVRSTLQRALTQLNSEKGRLDRQIAALETALGALGGRAQQTSVRRSSHKMSAAARRAIGWRMKAYWAKRRAAKPAKK